MSASLARRDANVQATDRHAHDDQTRASLEVRDRLIVCIASRWDIDPTSKHHVMTHLSRSNDVLWVNYHGSRRPRMNRLDASWAVEALRRVAAGPKRINARMVQFTPFVLPGAFGAIGAAINRRLVSSQIRMIAKRFRRRSDQPVQCWTFAPDVGYLAGAFDEECLVYYCVDEFSRFEGYDAARVSAAEKQLLAAADVVITTSAALQAGKSQLHRNVHLVRHGVDFAHFRRAIDCDLPAPTALAGIPRPIAGFVGLVQSWVDIELLCKVAGSMPDVSFVLVGDARVDVSRLTTLQNVHLVGRRPYAELPAFMRAFDVGLIPFVCNELTRNVNPIKLREYLAAGLPVVSTDLPEVRAYAPCVAIANTVAEFVRAIRGAIDGADGPPQVATSRRALWSTTVAGEDWASVVQRVSEIVARAAASAHPSVAVFPG